MRKIIIILFVVVSSIGVFAQNVKEPTFIGEAALLNDDNTTTLLEKSTVQVQTKANAGIYLVGMGSVTTRMALPGCCAGIRTKSGELQIIVRAVDNNSDPLSIIQVMKFDIKKKERRADLSSAKTFSGTSSGNMKLVSFSGEKFGENSYLLTIPKIQSGEYGIIVLNPNVKDEKVTIVSCFGVD